MRRRHHRAGGACRSRRSKAWWRCRRRGNRGNRRRLARGNIQETEYRGRANGHGQKQELAAKQHAILTSAARLVKSGGRLVYATCSLLAEENEAIADAFTTQQRDFVPLSAGELLAQLKVPHAASLASGGEDGQRHMRLWPHRHQTDGFFAAVWQRR